MSVSIYALYDEENILYIGVSKQPAIRYRQHLTKNPKTSSLCSLEDVSNVKMYILEEVSEGLRYATEGFYIDWLKPLLNKCVTGIGQRESERRYKAKNADKVKERHNKYHQENIERRRENQRIYQEQKRYRQKKSLTQL